MLACSRRPLRNKECILYWTELRCDCLCNNMCYCWSAQDVSYVLGWVCAAKLFQKIPTETFSVAPVTVGEVVFCSSASTILQCDDSVNETRTKCFIKSASIKLDLYSTVLTKNHRQWQAERNKNLIYTLRKGEKTFIFPLQYPGRRKDTWLDWIMCRTHRPRQFSLIH